MTKIKIKTLALTLFAMVCVSLNAQVEFTLKVKDSFSGMGIAEAKAKIIGENSSEFTSDSNGWIKLKLNKSALVKLFAEGYAPKSIQLNTNSDKIIEVLLSAKTTTSKIISITHNKQKEKLRESPVTVESLSAAAIKETPASDFYEGLGHLRGVDVTTASLGFKVVNTRGFNSTSPVRSLQLIDGVDNQSPGLNFSLGNFLGASELDIENAEIIVGASSAYFGPNAFNGAINMISKSPWNHKGLTASVKLGERQFGQLMLRYANTIKNKKDKEVFAYKFNLSYMRAYDWEATNSDSAYNTKSNKFNPGGYDAVNRYGDEVFGTAANDQVSDSRKFTAPGLGAFYRDGYWERELINYNTNNLKTNLLLAYKINDKNEIQYNFNFGTGTTIYQGDNRYSLRDILFFQNRIEWVGKKGFLRFYSTMEDAGNTFDVVLTAFLMQDYTKDASYFYGDYQNYWSAYVVNRVKALPGYAALGSPVKANPKYNPNFFEDQTKLLQKYNDSLVKWHSETRTRSNTEFDYQGKPRLVETYPRMLPGTEAFNMLKNQITSNNNFSKEGKLIGSRFFDQSALYHVTGERRFRYVSWNFTTGFSARMYKPYSKGTIFLDTGNTRITNVEAGVYGGFEKRLLKNKVKINGTARIDKNQNFNYLFSPAASVIYSKTKRHTYRVSLSSAIRNPTLADQYLHYNVGRAILLGNINGVNNVYETDNFVSFLNTLNLGVLKPINVKGIQPEKVKTVEFGYKGFLIENKLALDAGYYFSMYRDFIGYRILIDADIDSATKIVNKATAYRIASNSLNRVSTQGISAGINYFFSKAFLLNANWSWNVLNRYGEADPLIPAFNTPKHKFNVGVGASDIGEQTILGKKINAKNWGFNTNFKWIQGFLFEGSPQFTGFINSYWMLDAQISKKLDKIKSTLKIGASNLTNNKVVQVYGGPQVGRMAYISLLWEPGLE